GPEPELVGEAERAGLVLGESGRGFLRGGQAEHAPHARMTRDDTHGTWHRPHAGFAPAGSGGAAPPCRLLSRGSAGLPRVVGSPYRVSADPGPGSQAGVTSAAVREAAEQVLGAAEFRPRHGGA